MHGGATGDGTRALLWQAALGVGFARVGCNRSKGREDGSSGTMWKRGQQGSRPRRRPCVVLGACFISIDDARQCRQHVVCVWCGAMYGRLPRVMAVRQRIHERGGGEQ